MGRSERIPAVLVLVVILMGTGGTLFSVAQEEEEEQAPAEIARSEVDQACAASRGQLAVYEGALDLFHEATAEWDIVLEDIEIARGRADVAESLAARKAEEVEVLRADLEEAAIQIYMQQGVLALTPFLGETPGDLIVGQHYLETGTETKVADINNYLSSQRDLNLHREEIAVLEAELLDLQSRQESWTRQLALATGDQYAAWEELDDECQELVRKWEAQEARKRAEEARRRAEEARRIAAERAAEARRREQARIQAAALASRQGQGIGPIPGLVCPFPGSAFVDSWGAPRSGGRSHKGVDMFGPRDAPLLATAAGTITITNGGLGGRGLWIHSDTGVAYYYAHLSGWAVSEGDRVAAGQVVGYNGSTGNAWGGLPHLHLQLHPTGREGPAYNPYPTVRAAC
ncbi:MAG: M23 family metallopeptidase [bacterium]|nr:M23 family metallopeptidase [bacterium]MDE0235557.1 M23 family metallopeptidase [bacterium]